MDILVDLGRRFYKADDKYSESFSDASYLSFLYDKKYGHGMSWEDLLKEKLVVILGEPGSGKSKEFLLQEAELKKSSKPAFRIELSRLVDNSFEEAIGHAEYQNFLDWKTQKITGYFFFDSVDESKLKSHSDFFFAIDKLRESIEIKNLDRAHLFFSSRISEWRVQTDKQELIQRLPGETVDEDGKVKERPLVVHLAALDEERVERFARALEIADPALFIKALNENYAWDFARRPLDVRAIIEYWRQHGDLGSLTELIEFSVSRRLEDARGQDELPVGSAREGAEYLAAASLLCKNLHFKVPDPQNGNSSALSPIRCLPDSWSEASCRKLLSRSIFDDAIYGCFRFHHRREQEYLAASWVLKLWRNGCPLDRIEALLFEVYADKKVIRPSLAPIAAWIADGNDPINVHMRSLILKYAPETFLRYGDPSRLSIEYKRNLIIAMADAYKGKQRAWVRSDSGTLKRLGDPALAGEIGKIILDSSIALDFRSEMILMVGHGRILGALEDVYRLAVNKGISKQLRSYGFWVIRDHAGEEMRERLKSYALTESDLNGDHVATIIQALFPSHLSVEELAQILVRSRNNGERSYGLSWVLTEAVKHTLPIDLQFPLLERLLRLVRIAPYTAERQDVPISKRYYWIRDVIPVLLDKILEATRIEDRYLPAISDAISLLEVHWHEHGGGEREIRAGLIDKIRQHPEVKQFHFWRRVDILIRKNKEVPVYTGHVFGFRMNIMVSFEKLDELWLLNDAFCDKSDRNKVIAFRLCVNSWYPYKLGGIGWWGLLRCKIHLNDKSVNFLGITGKKFFWPFISMWWRYGKHGLLDRYKWSGKFASLRGVFRKLRNIYTLHRFLPDIRNGKSVGMLYYVVHRVESKSKDSRYTDKFWRMVRKSYGPWVSKAVKLGCETAWRLYKPELVHEKDEPNAVYNNIPVGLCGIQSGWVSGSLRFSELTQDEAELLARYALNGWNGFPEWFSEFYESHKKTTQRIIAECIHSEWEFGEEYHNVGKLTDRILWNGKFLVEFALTTILAEVKVRDPLSHDVLSTSLSLVVSDGSRAQLDSIKDLIPGKLRAYTSESEYFSRWLTFWIEIDAFEAVEWLTVYLSGLSPQLADSVMLRLCNRLQHRVRRERSEGHIESLAAPRTLSKFIPMVFKHVRPSEVIVHPSGVPHSVTPRDEAEQFRGLLLKSLGDSSSPEAESVLRELQGASGLESHKEWIGQLIIDNVASLSDHEAWEMEGFHSFAREYEVMPRNDFSLFKMAINRVNDVKTQVEFSENSLRDEVQAGWDERRLRQWFARKLLGAARGRYSVPQENEIDRQERIDLHLMTPLVGVGVPIELKLANSTWSINQHFDRLENQLVGQYLRARNVNYGIYLVGRVEADIHWRHPVDGHNVEFPELIKILEEKAKSLINPQAGIWGIQVVGVDFTEPIRVGR